MDIRLFGLRVEVGLLALRRIDVQLLVLQLLVLQLLVLQLLVLRVIGDRDLVQHRGS